MLGWLVGWLAGWLVGWLAGWLVRWLAGWLVGGLVAWLLGCLVAWLLGCSGRRCWLAGCLLVWLAGRWHGICSFVRSFIKRVSQSVSQSVTHTPTQWVAQLLRAPGLQSHTFVSTILSWFVSGGPQPPALCYCSTLSALVSGFVSLFGAAPPPQTPRFFTGPLFGLLSLLVSAHFLH